MDRNHIRVYFITRAYCWVAEKCEGPIWRMTWTLAEEMKVQKKI